ncbi:MAG: hypothetical protein O2854_06180 [Chloroflexi bacterium]|nr:hypothetical protein [Chloroflexota bacterium]
MRRIVLGIAAVLLLAVLACSDSSPSTQGSTSPTVQETATSLPTSEPVVTQQTDDEPTGNTFLDLLSLVPDTPETRQGVFVNDFARIRDLCDIALPGPDADQQALLAYFRDVTHPADFTIERSFISGLGGFQPFATQNLGFTIRDVDADLYLSDEAAAEDVFLEVVLGRFDPETANRLMKDCADCLESVSSRYSAEEYKRLTVHAWGDGLILHTSERYTAPIGDSNGRSMPTVVSSNYLARAMSTDFTKSVIDAAHNDASSLTDTEEFEQLAKALDSLGVHSAFVSGETHQVEKWLEDRYLGAPDWQIEAILQIVGRVPLMVPYRAFATGVGKDTEPFAAIVIVNSNSRDASLNAQVLRARLNEGRMLNNRLDYNEWFERIDVQTNGSVLTVKIYGEVPVGNWVDRIVRGEYLIVHE